MTPAAPPAAAADALSPANKAKASYALGLNFGKQMKSAGLSTKTLSQADFDKGLQAALEGAEIKREDMEPVQSYVMALRQAHADENHAKAKDFLAANAKKPGVTTTPSGLQYRVVREGHGDPPKRTDSVNILYTGRLLDGTVFDSTDAHGGGPAKMPVGGVIPGFTEILMLMKPGSKYEVWIPPALAYDMQSPPVIPPGSLLHFDIELQSIAPPPAPGAQGQGQGQGGQAPHPMPMPHPAPQTSPQPAPQPH